MLKIKGKTKAVKELFTQSKGAVAITEARCITNKVQLPKMSDDVFVKNFAPSSLKNIFKG